MPTTTSATSPYVDLSREQWSALRARTPLTLTADEVERLRGLGDVVDLDEVVDVYLPLARLLNLYIAAHSGLRGALNTFLGDAAGGARGAGPHSGTPFVIGVAGSVAVGKSTTARLLQALLAVPRTAPDPGPGAPDTPDAGSRPEAGHGTGSGTSPHPGTGTGTPEDPAPEPRRRVELVTTDGFLWPNDELHRRGLMSRKGFPESYDRRALTRFVADVKSGRPEVSAPVYSHLIYDIVPGERLVVRRPDILIVEGLNVLQPALPGTDGRTRIALADHFDFSVYVDARTEDVEQWYLDRFRQLRQTAFQDPHSYFRTYTQVPEAEALEYARRMWRTVNEPNLLQNILPTRGRATLVLRKGPGHKVRRLSLRKL